MRGLGPTLTRATRLFASAAAIWLAGAGGLFAGPRQIPFNHLTLEDGLSQGAINAILQDREGFMWFGTQDGLNRFDGYNFRVFRNSSADPETIGPGVTWSILEDHEGVIWVGTDGGLNRWNSVEETFTRFVNDPADPTSLSSNRVRALFEDEQGMLWVGTESGLNRFDRTSSRFTRFSNDPSNPVSLSDDRVRALIQDHEGVLWVATDGGGVNRLDGISNTFTHFRHDSEDDKSLSGDRIRSLYEDSNGDLWIGTYENGLNRFDRSSETFTRFTHDPGSPTTLTANLVRALFEDEEGTLWVGTDDGLNLWDSERQRFQRFTHSSVDPGSLRDNRVTSIYQDRGGVLWVGTQGGLSRWASRAAAFTHFRVEPEADNTLSNSVVNSLFEDRDGTLWIGTYDGLNRYDPKSESYRHYFNDPNDTASLTDDRVMALLVDSSGRLWAGTFGGLNRLNRKTGKFTRFVHDPERQTSLGRNAVTALFEDSKGVIWVATFGGGLNRYDSELERFYRYRHDSDNPTSLSSDRVTSLDEDQDGVLWVGTDGGGLNRFDRNTGTFSRYVHSANDPRSLGHNTVWSIQTDAAGTLWIGTQAGGLHRWDAADRSRNLPVFHRYTTADGLPNEGIYGILEDEANNLWLSTNSGLSRFNPATGVIKNFDSTYGLQSNEFQFGAYHRSTSGQMFFGGINGFNAFYPEQIQPNISRPAVVLTDFFKLNERVPIDDSINEAGEVELHYQDYVVAFEFAALDYTAPAKNVYAYKLEGFDADWFQLGTNRRVTYTNLDPGSYTLRVRAANNDGVWNEEGVSMPIRVIPPPWKSWWAYCLYALTLAGVIYGYTHSQAQKLEREAEYSRKLEEEVQERTHELERSNDDLVVANEKLEEASVTDSLTGLRNRRFLMTNIQQDIALLERQYQQFVSSGPTRSALTKPDYLFLMIDLDGLKGINDGHGHAAGDQAILELRDILEQACRKSDTIIRWGGDEFLVVGRNVDRQSAERLAERIRSAVAECQVRIADDVAELTCSIGFAFYPFVPHAPTLVSWEQTVAIADRALYAAKASGRDAWVSLSASGLPCAPDLVQRVLTEPEKMLAEGAMEVLTSLPRPEDLVWNPEDEYPRPVRAVAHR